MSSLQQSLRVGLIGYGAIGQGVSRLLDERADSGVMITAALVRNVSRFGAPNTTPVVGRFEDVLASEPDVIVEVAGQDALREYGPAVLQHGYDLFLLSVGALADASFEEQLRNACHSSSRRSIIMSGAIGGLDALSSAAFGGLSTVRHTTRKPASTLLGPEKSEEMVEAIELFRGAAREGVQIFPESVNVAAAVSLAGIGFDRTELCVIADPAATQNQHVVEAEGEFGSLRFEIHNRPSASNPKTGRLVAMSVLHHLTQRVAPIVIG